MKKILVLNKYYLPVVGGVESVVQQYSQFLSEKYIVKVLVCHEQISSKSHLDIVTSNLHIYYSRTLFVLRKLPISFQFILNFYKLSRWADIIHVHEPFPLGMFLSIFCSRKVKIIVTWHSDIHDQKYLAYIVRPLQNILLRKATFITTTSDNLLKFSDQLFIHRKKVTVLPLSIDTHSYSFTNSSVSIANDLESILMTLNTFCLFLGRLSNYKGVQVLISVYEKYHEQLPPIFIIGKGEVEDSIISLKKKFPAKVYFLNRYLTSEEKVYVLNKCTIFLFPSNKISEAFGITQLEAMFASKPVINTNLPTGVPWVSQHNITGITVEVDDVDAFATAIINLIDDSDLRNRLGLNGRSRVLNLFSNDKNFQLLGNLFDSV